MFNERLRAPVRDTAVMPQRFNFQISPSPAQPPEQPLITQIIEPDTAPDKTTGGGDCDYWIAHIEYPKRLVPYSAECEDLIEHFEFSFAEGEAFKALWRMGAARVSDGKAGDSEHRNIEKLAHFSQRLLVKSQRLLRQCVIGQG